MRKLERQKESLEHSYREQFDLFKVEKDFALFERGQDMMQEADQTVKEIATLKQQLDNQVKLLKQ